MKIVVDDKIPFLKGVLESYAEVIYLPGKKISREYVHDAEALLIRTRTNCSETLLEGSSVRFIGTATIGFDHIDTEYCRQRNIAWTNAPGCNSSSVNQYIAAALLKLQKDHGFVLKDKTIGIIGVGNVGSKVEKFARAIGMNVLLNDPPRARKEGASGFVTVNNILNESDIITLHVPLNVSGEDATYHLINEDLMGKLNRKIWIFNSSRGEVCDSSVLKRALKEGLFCGAVIDVWENEPDIDLELLTQTYIATPHIAGYSTDGKANGTAMVVNSLSRFFKLPLTDWYPDDIPTPENPLIEINCKGKDHAEILREAVIHSYDIAFDDANLRSSPSDFEKLRGDYRLRREFHAYIVKLSGGDDSARKLLEDIGFKVEQEL